MRLWSLHPRFLDPKGLVALWREGLLAQAVLLGRTRGYRQHPQLIRFRGAENPAQAIASYLRAVAEEARHRGYAFDTSKIEAHGSAPTLTVTEGQLRFEWQHLLAKLAIRDVNWLHRLPQLDIPEPHPLFLVTPGPPASWEKGAASVLSPRAFSQ